MSLMDVFVKIGADTSGLESGLDKAKNLASGLGNGVKNAMKVAGAAIAGATTAVGGFAASAVSVGRTFDASMSQVAATMGVTTDEIQNLRDYAMEMGAKTAFSATQAADALNYMALAGYDAETSMNMLPNVLNLAAAGNIELAQASDMVTDAQSALGLSLEETTELVDMMAQTASKSNTSVQQLGDAILTIGGTAQTLAGGTTELNTALGILADNGIKGAEGGTKLRNVILSLSAPTDTAATALANLGIETVDAEGNMKSLQSIVGDFDEALNGLGTADKAEIISSIFNKQDIAAVNALLNTNGDRWNELTGYIDDAAGAAEKMAETQLDNLEGDITLFKSALEGAQLIISDGLMPGLREFVQFGTEGLTKISDGFKEGGLSGAMDAFGEVLSGGISMITEKLPEYISAGMELLGAVGQGILDNLPQIVSASVQIAVEFAKGLITALPELAKGAKTLVTSLTEEFQKNRDTLSEVGNELLTMLLDGISTGLPEMMAMLAEFIAENAPALIDGISSVIGTIATALTDPAMLNSLFTSGMTIITTLIQSLTSNAGNVGVFATSFVNQIRGFISEAAPTLISSGIQLIKELAEGFIQGLPAFIVTGIDTIIALANSLTDPVNIATIIQVGLDLLMALVNGLLEGIPRLVDDIPLIISNLVAALVAAIPQIIEAGIFLLVALATGLVQAIPRLVAKIPAIILALVGGLVKGIVTIGQVGKDMVAGLWNGIKERWEGLVRDFQNLASGLVDGIKGIFGIHSPSTVFAEIGDNLDKGLAKGLNRSKHLVDDAMASITDSVNGQIEDVSFRVNANTGAEGFGSYNFTQIINAPTELSPSEIARQTKNANRNLMLALRGV